MGEGICLYGSRKRPDAPSEFTVDTSVSCFLFGIEHYLCRYLDLIVAKGGGSVRGFVKALIKRIIGQVLEGDIETEGFCRHGVPPLPEDINYIDVFTCFQYGDCDYLLGKITGFYHFKKFYELCECIPLPPEPDPFDPDTPIPLDPNGLPIYPEDPPIPPGDCAQWFAAIQSGKHAQEIAAREEFELYRQGILSIGWIPYLDYSSTPSEKYPNLLNKGWEQPQISVPNPCRCQFRIEFAFWGGMDRISPDGTQSYYVYGGNHLGPTTLYRFFNFRQLGCPDNTGDGGQGLPQYPPEPDLYPDFPWMRPKKKPKTGGAKCGCCNYQWRKDKNELYLPSRRKI